MKVKYTLVYNRKKRLNKDGLALIQIRAYQGGQNKYFSTQIYVAPFQWDAKREKIKKHSNQYHLNKQIANQIDEMETYELQMTAKQNGKFYLQQLEYYQVLNQFESFTHFFEQEMEQEEVKPSTRQTYEVTLKRLKAFKRIIYFEDLDYNLIRKFDQYLIKRKCSANTRAKYHKILKKFIHLAIKMDLMDIRQNPYKLFTVKKERTSRDFLSEDELNKLADLVFDEMEIHLENIRDLFLFCCYTGLRYSDVSRLAKVHLLETDKGLKLDMVSQKTEKRIQLPLFKLFQVEKTSASKPELIAYKYLKAHLSAYGEDRSFQATPFFKGLSEQHVNRELKRIASRAGIKKKLTTHVGRHTFGTIMAIKISPTILQQLMQHSHLKETMIYVHLSNTAIEKELDKVQWD